ncbi:MAG: hypothetical protein Q8N81_06645 [bacterium]|nr:hypothetical protein [bacterium]
MKKFLIILVLLSVILVSFGFAALKILANGPDNNYFNRNLRQIFFQHRFWRETLGLHYDGDGRYDYLGNGDGKIMLEVDVMSDLSIQPQALELVRQRIEQITGKQVLYYFSSSNIPYKQSVSMNELEGIMLARRDFAATGKDAKLQILYLSRDSAEPQLLGRTVREDGIVLYEEALVDFTKSNPDTLSAYEASTILHEFGHQLGLPHNEAPDCLMNSSAEQSHVAREVESDVVTDFCLQETELIKQLRN